MHALFKEYELQAIDAEGDYGYNIELFPRYTGKYYMNPAKVDVNDKG